jgi:hypothetical protein
MNEALRTNDELRRIFLQRVPPKGRDESDWKNEREHALGEYWSRRLAACSVPLSRTEVDEILSYAELDTALATLGDAARLNLLSRVHCDELLGNKGIDTFPKAGWVKGEIQLRVLVDRLVRASDSAARRELLHHLLHQKRYWALEAILEGLSDNELEYCEECLQDHSVLTRHNRERARLVIRRLRRGV